MLVTLAQSAGEIRVTSTLNVDSSIPNLMIILNNNNKSCARTIIMGKDELSYLSIIHIDRDMGG